jgi:hypothetical protein
MQDKNYGKFDPAGKPMWGMAPANDTTAKAPTK